MTLTRRQFLVATGVAGLAVSGCGSTAIEPGTGPALAEGYTGPPVTISFWNGFTGGDGPAMRRLVTAFNESQDRIVVAQNTVRWEQFYQRVVAAVHAGKGPDVGAMHLEQLGTQAARQTVNPLDDVVDELGLRPEEYPQSVWEAGRYRDRRYGIPFDVHSLASFANLDLLGRTTQQQPADAQGLQATMTALQQAGVDTPLWVPNAWPAHLIVLSLLWQHGGEPYALDGSRATFDSDAGVAALQWMRGQVDAGFSPPNVAEDSQYTAFKNGQGVFTWDGIWQINDLEDNNVPYGIAPLPTIFDEQAQWANSHHFFISRQGAEDENKAQAAQVFIAWLSDQSAEWAGSAMIPARESEREGAAEFPQAPIAEVIDAMHFLPPVPGLGGAQTEGLEPQIANGVLGEAPPADALGRAASQVTELMERNRESFGD